MSTEEIIGNILKYGVGIFGAAWSIILWRKKHKVWAGIGLFLAVMALSLGRIIAGDV